MGKYGTYLEFNGSHEAPKHRKTFGSITQFCARAHFRSPHRSLREPQGASHFVCHHISTAEKKSVLKYGG